MENVNEVEEDLNQRVSLVLDASKTIPARKTLARWSTCKDIRLTLSRASRVSINDA